MANQVSEVTLEGHKATVFSIAQFESQGLIVSTSDDKTVKSWKIEQATEHRTLLINHDLAVTDIAPLDDGRMIMTGFDRTVIVSRIADGRILAKRWFPHSVTCVGVVNSSTALVGDFVGTVYKLRITNDKIKILNTIEDAHKDGEISSIHVHSNRFSTTVDHGDKTARLWDLETCTLIHTFDDYKGSLMSAVFDDDYFVSASYDDDAIFVYNAQTFSLITTIRLHAQSIECVRLFKDTNILIAGGGERILALFSLPSGECIAKFDTFMWIRKICVLPSGKVAICGEQPCNIKIFDIPQLSEPINNSSNLRNKRNTTTTTTTTHCENDDIESTAVKLFREAAAANEGGNLLTIDDATQVLNNVFDGEKQIDAQEFERIFMQVSDELQVCETSFLRILNELNKGDQELQQYYATQFKKYVNKRDSVSVHFAIRILRESHKLVGRQNFPQNQIRELEQDNAALRELMTKFDVEGNASLNCDNFVAAALSILHGIEEH